MNRWQLIRASLRHYRRVHLAVAAGVAVATAVITGALLVGDSVRGSLRELSLSRLGAVDTVLTATRPFRSALAEETLARLRRPSFTAAEPVLRTRGTLVRDTGGGRRRAAGLSVLGVRGSYWRLGDGQVPELTGNRIALTRGVAEELGARPGDTLLLRLPQPGSSPGESLLGERLDATAARRVTVAEVLDSRGIAAFSLTPSQQTPRNVFVSLDTLGKLLGVEQRANAVLFAATDESHPAGSEAREALRGSLRPRPADFGIRVETEAPAGLGPIATVSSDRLVLAPHVVDAAQTAFGSRVQPVVTYLANTIGTDSASIPYSTVTGVTSTAAAGPLRDGSGVPIVLAEDEVVLNDWAASDLGAVPGDAVTLTFYEPETTHGRLAEAPPLRLRLRAVVPLEDADGRPTPAASPGFAPLLPGVTDQQSIDDWDLPFPLVEQIRPQDDDYWDAHRTAPKAFVSLPLAERLWATRWGKISLLRVPLAEGESAESVSTQLAAALDPQLLGMTLTPAKQRALEAASGTTPFEGLFIGFSLFLVASAVMLIVLLFRLGVEGRAREFGLLAACGLSPGASLRIASAEAAVVAAAGAAAGTAAGIGYARIIIHGLSTWWVEATAVPFIRLHTPAASLAAGALLGFAVGAGGAAWSLRRLLRQPCRRLLAGALGDTPRTAKAGRVSRIAPPLLLVLAAASAASAFALEGEAQAGAFFGAGALVLSALVWRLRATLLRPEAAATGRFTPLALSAVSARRNPTRSLLSVGLTAVACFLIVAIGAFRIAPSESGTGGFDLIASADRALVYDPSAADGREELFLSGELSGLLAESRVEGFRVREGEDASCLNLYQTAQPTVLGVPRSLRVDSRFGWGGVRAGLAEDQSPWSLLDADLGSDDAGRAVVPVILDKNTAAYSLHLAGVGARLTVRDAADNPVTLEVVALLAGSVLQGKLMIAEGHFLRLFPENPGRRLFLVRGPEGVSPERLSELLETDLSDYGIDAESAREVLRGYLAVQNTYLSTFQSLGGLGLLLGTVGLAVAQLRSVVERRGELALMRAVGFRAARIGEVVLGENLVLLSAGLVIGCAAALLAVLPHAWIQGAQPPWHTLALLVATVAATGALAGGLAVRSALAAPLLSALRGD